MFSFGISVFLLVEHKCVNVKRLKTNTNTPCLISFFFFFILRYIAVEVNPLGQCGTKSCAIEGRDLYQSVLDTVLKLHGDFGAAAISSGFSGLFLTCS